MVGAFLPRTLQPSESLLSLDGEADLVLVTAWSGGHGHLEPLGADDDQLKK